MGGWPAVVEALEALTDLVLPRSCAACGRPASGLCATCSTRLFAELVCAGPPRDHEPVPRPAGLPPTTAAGWHEGALAAAIVACKDRERSDLAGVLGGILASAIHRQAPTGPVAIVPVPSSGAARRRRGRDPLGEVVAAAAALLGSRAAVHPVLRQRRALADQAGLARGQRLANLEGGMRCLAPITHGRVVVVDDIVTTGATLTEAARALRAAGHEPLAAVVAARRATLLRAAASPARPDLVAPDGVD